MADETRKPKRILRRRELCSRTGLGPSIVKDRHNPRSPRYDPDFPRPIRLGDGANSPVGYLEEEVDRWIELRAQRRDPLPAEA
jgi:prophage regulatory protein